MRLDLIATVLLSCLLSSASFLSPSAQAAPPDGKKYLIIHADDAGMSHSVNRATIDALENGLVSSASIMVPCPWFKEFARYAQAHPEYDYGIHLTLNSEWENYRWGPVMSRDQVPSLIDEEGYLWDNVSQVASHVKAEEVALELRAQIDRAKAFGVPLSHLDTHMGAVLSRPDLLKVYVKLGLEYDLPVLFMREFDEKRTREYPALAKVAAQFAKQLDQQGLPLLDELAQFYDGESHDQRRAKYLQAIHGVEAGVTQIIIHCGYADEELRSITSSAQRRDGDRLIFMEPEVASLIDKLDIQLIGWKQLRALEAKKQTGR